MIPTHVFVTAAEGREVPIPPSEGSAPGAMLLRCKPGKVYRLMWSTYTRRRILAGDLLPTTIGGLKVAELEQAAAGDLDQLGYLTDSDGAVVAKPVAAPAPAPAAPAVVPTPPAPLDAAATTTRKG